MPDPALNWLEIDGEALRHNLREFRRRVGGAARIAAVVKSNAYGHGLLEVSRIVRDEGADWLAVNSLDEGLALCEAGFDLPVLLMGYVPVDGCGEVVRHGLRPTVYNEETLEALEREAARAGATVPVHLKVETGTNRQGVAPERWAELAGAVRARPHLRLEGVTTHFANIEDTTDHRFAESQVTAFHEAVEAVGVPGEEIVRHAACSAAAILFDRTHLDLVRIGISLYGLWPSRETLVSCRERHKQPLDLHPALTWKTRIAQIKDVPRGGFVGYGCTWRATRPTRIAVLPVGYHEGYDRRLSNRAHVLVGGHRAPVRGRVCMNLTMVDVTDVPEAALEQEVVLLGEQGDERVSADLLAEWCGTIHYEVVSRIHPALPRRVV